MVKSALRSLLAASRCEACPYPTNIIFPYICPQMLCGLIGLSDQGTFTTTGYLTPTIKLNGRKSYRVFGWDILRDK